MEQKATYRLVVAGTGGVGKSAIVLQLVQNQFFEEFDPTVEGCYTKQLQIDHELCSLDLFDIAGQDEFRYDHHDVVPMKPTASFLIQVLVVLCLLVLSGTSTREGVLRAQDAAVVPTVLVANKCDLADARREVMAEEGARLAESWGCCRFLESSAKSRINIDEAFIELVRTIRAAPGEANRRVHGHRRSRRAKSGRSRGCTCS
jgi:GTPase KRas protein